MLALGGCAARLDPSPEMEISRLAGGQAIAYRTEAEPTDIEDSAELTALAAPEAVREALDHSPELQAALARVRIAEAEADQAHLLPNPILSVAFRYPEGGGSPVIEAGLAAELFGILMTPWRADAAANRLRAEAARSVVVALDIIAKAQEAHAQALAAEGIVAAIEEDRERLAKLKILAEARLKAGEGIRSEVTTLSAQLAVLDIQLAEQRQARTAVRLALNRMLGRPSAPFELVLEETPEPTEPLPEESRLIAVALERRPEARAALWELAAAGDERALAMPSPFAEAQIGADAEKDGDWQAGPAFSLPLPFLDWGQNRRAIAYARLVGARHETTQIRRQIIEEVRAARAALEATAATYHRIREALVPLQTTRRSELDLAYRAGQVDLTALLLADQDLFQAKERDAELGRDLTLARIRLERAIGGPLDQLPSISGDSQ